MSRLRVDASCLGEETRHNKQGRDRETGGGAKTDMQGRLARQDRHSTR